MKDYFWLGESAEIEDDSPEVNYYFWLGEDGEPVKKAKAEAPVYDLAEYSRRQAAEAQNQLAQHPFAGLGQNTSLRYLGQPDPIWPWVQNARLTETNQRR